MFSRTESFSQYIRLYPVVTFFLALNILIFLLTYVPIIGASTIFQRNGNQLSDFQRRMVAIVYTDVPTCRTDAFAVQYVLAVHFRARA